MQLIIDGKDAVLKKGSSFDYVSENRSFSDADDYTLSITLPLVLKISTFSGMSTEWI